MLRFRWVPGIAIVVFLVLEAMQTVPASAAPARNEPHLPVPARTDTSVLDRVYTISQAEAGLEVFEGVCIRCHTTEQFLPTGLHAIVTKYPNLGEMFRRVSMTMPADDPGSLNERQYTAVMSYLLYENGYPAGNAEMPAEVDALLQVRIVPAPAK